MPIKTNIGIMNRCVTLDKEGLSYTEIAERLGLPSRQSVGGYIFRYRRANGLLGIKTKTREMVEASIKRGVEKSKTKRKQLAKGNPKAIRLMGAPMEQKEEDLEITIREDGVRITKDKKPRWGYGCGFDRREGI